MDLKTDTPINSPNEPDLAAILSALTSLAVVLKVACQNARFLRAARPDSSAPKAGASE